ncbi:hypothetical protein CAPTEDRAFT_202202 [Capitella teleta]|uniref:Thioredoxin-like fold domain-containing protein n=1 Tax=Capitella teleta TaxID=283909 RepID=R7V8M0_CAPTE|nr:hypothetical protein CAPTEDRAFT_202202 [Capitella teleta]|eukprot:ELU12105.1 hypothetical protein CAPTEDRAFT_202202 [Capitella teleta]
MKLILLFTLVATVSAAIHVPIPLLSENPGFKLDPSSTGDVTIEVFLELLCFDSDISWGIINDLQQHYGPENLNIVVHIYSLPYHRNAFLFAQGLYQVADLAPEFVHDYVDMAYANRPSFGDDATVDETETEIVGRLSVLAESVTGIPANDFAADIYNYRIHSIYTWKYAALRGTAGTPWFHVNNVDLASGGSSPTFEEWVELLDPLIN